MSAPAGLEQLWVRLYLDKHVKPQLADDLRLRGFDTLTTQEAGRDRASDEEQLAFATTEGRTILTYNTRATLHCCTRRGLQ